MFRWRYPLLIVMPFLLASTAVAQRPTAPRLLPESTVGYVRVDNAMELRELSAQSSIGRMLQDEQMKPLVGDIYLILDSLFNQISDRVGLTLDELLSLPQGELAFAVVPMDPPKEDADAPKDNSPDAIRARIEARRNQMPIGFVLMVETGDKSPLMRTLVQRLEDQAPGSLQRNVSTVTGIDVVSYRRGGNAPPLSYAEKDGCFIIGIGPGMVEGVLERWKDQAAKDSLAQNTDFGNVMSHCVGAEETRPQVTFYADPYHLVERLVKFAGGPAAAVWPILENLQIDKIKGIGGSTFSGGEEGFEGIVHLHLLLESPRDGILSVVRPGEGPTQPEDWVPDDLVSYTTLHWDVVKTYEGIGRIVGRFQSADALERFVEQPFKDRTDVDLPADVLEQLTGRLSILRWNEPPVRINSACQIWAVETKDIQQAQATLEKVTEAFNVPLKKQAYGGITLFAAEDRDQPGNLPENFRRPEPTLAIIGNYLVGSDSRKAIEHLVDTLEGRSTKLSESPDYDLIAGEVSGKLDAEQDPFLFTYMRGDEAIRPIYELARDPKNREFLRGPAENNPYVKMLLDTLEKNELPAFSAFSKYFAPSGSFAYDDTTGLHYATFTLKPLE